MFDSQGSHTLIVATRKIASLLPFLDMQLLRLSLSLVLLYIASPARGTPLDDYVNTPDPVYGWRRLQTYPQPAYTLYVLNMTSQQWFDGTGILLRDTLLTIPRSDSFSTQPIWWHYVTITVPRNMRRRRTAFLLISDGDNTDP